MSGAETPKMGVSVKVSHFSFKKSHKMEMLSEEGGDNSGMLNDGGLNGGAAEEEESESEEGTGLLGIKPNKKNKTKVNSIVKALKKNKEGKLDTSHITINS